MVKEILKSYTVWYDKDLLEHIAIESKELTLGLLINLKKERIETREVFSANRVEALGEAFPNLKKQIKPVGETRYKPKFRIY